MRSGNAGDTTEGTSCDQRETGDAGGGHTDSLFAFTPNYSEAEFLCRAGRGLAGLPALRGHLRIDCGKFPYTTLNKGKERYSQR